MDAFVSVNWISPFFNAVLFILLSYFIRFLSRNIQLSNVNSVDLDQTRRV